MKRKQFSMLRIIILTGILSICIFESRSQNKIDKMLDNFSCLTTVMLTGAEVGHWDTLNIKSSLSEECKDYFLERKFEINKDTLSIIKMEDLNSDLFIGTKVLLESDNSVVAYIYLKDYLKSKSSKRLKKKNYNTESRKPIVLRIKLDGDSHSVEFKSP